MTTAYAYEQLSDARQRIRLLYLDPATSATDELRGSLVQVDVNLQPAPEYEALSYAWGEPVLSDTLCLDGRGSHAITANLRQCLVSLRKADETRVLWVDAVCINQNDTREKERQVALMGKIYQAAQRALIWLGGSSTNMEWLTSHTGSAWGNDHGINSCTVAYRDGKRMLFWRESQQSTSSEESTAVNAVHIQAVEAPAEGEAFTFTSQSGRQMAVILGNRSSSPLPPDVVPLDGFRLLRRRAAERLGTDLHDLHLQQSLLRDAAIFKPVESLLGNDEVERALRYGIDEVYTNPWFTRMWVVQEVCLAPKAVILHRRCEMDWQDFSIAMHLLRACVTEEGAVIPAPAAFDRACELVRITGIYKAAGTLTKTADQRILFVSRLSLMLRGQKCSLEHDRVYALLNLQPEGSPFGSIVPDYTKPVLQVFREFTAELLSRGIIDVLCDAGAWERNDVPLMGFMLPTSSLLPTWVPDLRQENRNSHLPWLKHYFRQRLASTLISDPAATPVTVVETGEGFGLNVEILVIDKIQAALEAPDFPPRKVYDPERETSFDAVVKHVKKCRQLYESYRDPEGYPFGLSANANAETAFWATLVSFSEYTGTPSSVLGMILLAEGLQDMSCQFQKHCLDDDGVFAGGRESLDIEVRRRELLERLEDSGNPDKGFEFTTALVMYDMIRAAMNGTRFIVTRTGFVGLAPPTPIFDRDVIAMIRGTRIPFILRPVSGRESSYTLVGSCYVYGLMDWIIDGNYNPAHIF